MNIFLIGFMGSGKSTLGRKLASRLGYDFMDMDHEIEDQQGMTIAELFNLRGEAFFRQLEHDLILGFKERNTVIATGGGAPCFQNNLDLMKIKGKTIYLKMPVGMLVNRLQNAQGNRPLINHVKSDPAALRNFIAEKLAEREQHYLMADFVFEAGDVTPARIDELVLQLTAQKQL